MDDEIESPKIVFKSRSSTFADTIPGEHEFVINGYSLLKGIGNGEPIASDRFTVGGYDWVLLFYPDGKQSSADMNDPRVARGGAGGDRRRGHEQGHPAGAPPAPRAAPAVAAAAVAPAPPALPRPPPVLPGVVPPAPAQGAWREGGRVPAVRNVLPGPPGAVVPVQWVGGDRAAPPQPPRDMGAAAAPAAAQNANEGNNNNNNNQQQQQQQQQQNPANPNNNNNPGAAPAGAVPGAVVPEAPPRPEERDEERAARGAEAGQPPVENLADRARNVILRALERDQNRDREREQEREQRERERRVRERERERNRVEDGEERRGGRGEETEPYAALFVALIGEKAGAVGAVQTSDGRMVRAFHRFTLVDQEGAGRDLTKGRRRDQVATKISCSRQDPSARNCHGYRKFVRKSVLEDPANGFLRNDSIVIRYNIELITWQGGLSINRLGRQARPALPEVPPSLGPSMAALLESGDKADVVISVGDQEFKAHHVILTARSKVFRPMLDGEMRESIERRVTVGEMEPEVFRALLYFIYTDELPEEIRGRSLDAIMAQHLLMAADRFQLPRLRRICEQRLLENLDVETVCTTAALADHNKSAELKRRCLEFIAQNLPLVMKTASFQDTVAGNNSLMADILEVVAMNGHLPQPNNQGNNHHNNNNNNAAAGGAAGASVSAPQNPRAPHHAHHHHHQGQARGAAGAGVPPRGGAGAGDAAPAPPPAAPALAPGAAARATRPAAQQQPPPVLPAALPGHLQAGAGAVEAAGAASSLRRTIRNLVDEAAARRPLLLHVPAPLAPPVGAANTATNNSAGPAVRGLAVRAQAVRGGLPLAGVFLEEVEDLLEDSIHGQNVAEDDEEDEVAPQTHPARGQRREREDAGELEDGSGPDGRRVRARHEERRMGTGTPEVILAGARGDEGAVGLPFPPGRREEDEEEAGPPSGQQQEEEDLEAQGEVGGGGGGGQDRGLQALEEAPPPALDGDSTMAQNGGPHGGVAI